MKDGGNNLVDIKLVSDFKKNIKVGDFFTIIKWTSCQDNSFRGDCLEVMEKDKHLVRVARHPDRVSLGEFTLDLNMVDIGPLSDSFVNTCKQGSKRSYMREAAPDMYEALNKLVADNLMLPNPHPSAIDAANKALSKARGET